MRKVQRPFQDERDKEIDTHSKSNALEFMIAATQILTVMCLIRVTRHGKEACHYYLSAELPCCFINMTSMEKSNISRLGL